MRSRPRISVISVTLNDLDGLKRMKHSLEAQTYTNYEHVVVDGGSTDGTKEWLESFSHSDSIKWTSEPDDGIFDAMNKGVSNSRGELIIFMNSGDCFHDPTVLAAAAEHWAQSDWEWGYGQMDYVDGSGNVVGTTSQFSYSQRRMELGLAYAPHQGTFLSREFIQRLGGFDLRFEYACDQEFAMRAGSISKPLVLRIKIADFLVGGVHSQTTYKIRELLYHKMREKNNVLIAQSKRIDQNYAMAMAVYRESREWTAKKIRHVQSTLFSK